MRLRAFVDFALHPVASDNFELVSDCAQLPCSIATPHPKPTTIKPKDSRYD